MSRWMVGWTPSTSKETVRRLYRTTLIQARLLAHTLDDPIVYSSHRYLARNNLQPLLLPAPPASTDEDANFGASWPPSPEQKRLEKARTHRKNLANANVGWEHAVFHALSLAYAREGRLSRDIMTDLAHSDYEASPVVQAILTSQNSMDGPPIKDVRMLTNRPPPPYLPALDDALVKYYGRGKAECRLRNSAKKFRTVYRRKAATRLPLDVLFADESVENGQSIWAHLERRAAPPSRCVASPPSSEVQITPTPLYIASARMQALSYSSDMGPSEHRKRELRQDGWTSHPKDYTNQRTRQRIYGRILDQVPLLVLPAPTPPLNFDSLLTPDGRAHKDPLGIRAKIRTACLYSMQHNIPPNKIKLLKSRHAIGARSKGAEQIPVAMATQPKEGGVKWTAPSTWLDQSELDFLKENQILI